MICKSYQPSLLALLSPLKGLGTREEPHVAFGSLLLPFAPVPHRLSQTLGPKVWESRKSGCLFSV